MLHILSNWKCVVKWITKKKALFFFCYHLIQDTISYCVAHTLINNTCPNFWFGIIHKAAQLITSIASAKCWWHWKSLFWDVAWTIYNQSDSVLQKIYAVCTIHRGPRIEIQWRKWSRNPPAFYGTPGFITVFIRSHRRTISSSSSIQSTFSHTDFLS
jgi:hypothetical protein